MMSKFLDYGADKLGLGKSKVFILSLKPPFLWDVKRLFNQDVDDDLILFNYYLKDLDLLKMGKKKCLEIISDKVNQRMIYTPDIIKYKKPEYWASPIEVHRAQQDDCDGYAVLMCYLCRLLGFSPFEVFVRAGEIVQDNGVIDGHAHLIWFDWDTMEWYPIEGTMYRQRSLNNMGVIPMRKNDNYQGATYFITNEVLSFSNYPLKLVR
jgi:hypothetical protein